MDYHREAIMGDCIMEDWTNNFEFIRLMETCRVNNEDRMKLEDTYFLTFARMGKLSPDSPFPYCDDFNDHELAKIISTLIKAFKKPDYKKWEKIRAWRLHHAIAFLYDIDPDSFFSTLRYYYTLRDMGQFDTGKHKAFIFSQLISVSFPIDQVFILAQDEYKAGFFRIIGKWENNEEVLVDPFTFLQWAEKHGHQIPEELRGIQPPVETVVTHAEKVSTGNDDPAPDAEPYKLEESPGSDQKTLKDPGAVAYWNFVEAGMDWIPIGEKVFPDDFERLKNTSTFNNTFRSIPARAAKRYAKRNGYEPPHKDNKGKLMRDGRGMPVPKPTA
jgi:hypothetical protein